MGRGPKGASIPNDTAALGAPLRGLLQGYLVATATRWPDLARPSTPRQQGPLSLGRSRSGCHYCMGMPNTYGRVFLVLARTAGTPEK